MRACHPQGIRTVLVEEPAEDLIFQVDLKESTFDLEGFTFEPKFGSREQRGEFLSRRDFWTARLHRTQRWGGRLVATFCAC